MRSIISAVKNRDITTAANGILFLMFVGLCSAYILLLSQAVMNGAEHQHLSSEIPKMNAELHERQFDHISLRNDLNEERVEEFNLVSLQSDSVEYITRDPVGFRADGYGNDI